MLLELVMEAEEAVGVSTHLERKKQEIEELPKKVFFHLVQPKNFNTLLSSY